MIYGGCFDPTNTLETIHILESKMTPKNDKNPYKIRTSKPPLWVQVEECITKYFPFTYNIISLHVNINFN